MLRSSTAIDNYFLEKNSFNEKLFNKSRWKQHWSQHNECESIHIIWFAKKLMRFLPNNLLQFSHSARHERYVLKWRPLWALFANQLSNLRKCVPCWHLSRNLSWSRLLTILFSGSQLSCLPHVCSLAAIGGLLLLLLNGWTLGPIQRRRIQKCSKSTKVPTRGEKILEQLSIVSGFWNFPLFSPC